MKTVKQPKASGNPFDFAAPVVKFKKLDDLPKGKPNTADQVMQAMKALYKMVHAQAHAYGGTHGKLLPVGIAENSLLKQFEIISETDEPADELGNELDEAYEQVNTLVDHFSEQGDEEGMKLVLKMITHITKAVDLSSGSKKCG
jgi:hypothetical protein